MTVGRCLSRRSRRRAAAADVIVLGVVPAAGCGYECKAIGYLDSISVIVGPGMAGPPVRLCLDDACSTDGPRDGDGRIQLDPGRVVAYWSAGRMPHKVAELRLTTATLDVRLAKPKIVTVYPQDKRCGGFRTLELRYDAATNALVPATG